MNTPFRAIVEQATSIKSPVTMSLSARRSSWLGVIGSFLIGSSGLWAQVQPASPVDLPAPAVSNTNFSNSDGHPVQPDSRNYDPLLDPPPLPNAAVSLLGGMVTEVNEIQNRITVQPFGGKQRLHMNFDVRTHVYRDGLAVSERDLKAGERVYLDTMLNGGKVFARSIWIRSNAGSGNGKGQIIRYDSRANAITVRDEVSAQPVVFRLDSGTAIRDGLGNGSVEDLKPGALVAVSFDPAQGRSGIVREISILAEPGASFTFLGKVTFIDLGQKLIAVTNHSDDKNYDIHFETIPANVLQSLQEGTEASISAVFDGSQYVAQKIDVITGAAAAVGRK